MGILDKGHFFWLKFLNVSNENAISHPLSGTPKFFNTGCFRNSINRAEADIQGKRKI